MNIRYFWRWLFSLFIIAAIAMPLEANAAKTLGIGTSPQGTLTYRLGSTYAAVLHEHLGIQARVQPNSGTQVMIPLVNSGELDVGFADSLEISSAYNGTGEFKGHPQKNIRMIAVIFPIQVGIFTKKNSKMETVDDLKGKRIPMGYLSQRVIDKINRGILANGGLTLKDVHPVKVSNLIQGVDDFVSGDTDVAFFAIGAAKVSEAASRVGGIKFLDLSKSPAAVKAMQKVAPTTKVVTVQPRSGLAGINKPTQLMQYEYTVFVNKDVPKEKVRKLTQALIKYKKREAQSSHFFKALKLKKMYNSELKVPYASGAKSFYKASGITVNK